MFQKTFLYTLYRKTIFEEAEEHCSGSVSPPALEVLPNNSKNGYYDNISVNELNGMTVDQLHAIAIWQNAQIQHQNQYLNQKKISKYNQQNILLAACNKLSLLQSKVSNLRWTYGPNCLIEYKLKMFSVNYISLLSLFK